MNVPIFNGHLVKQQIKQAMLDLDYQSTLYNYQLYRVQNAISIAFKNYTMQLKTLELEEENILMAKRTWLSRWNETASGSPPPSNCGKLKKPRRSI